MLKQLRKKTGGFTIIEVMIVLAIAGLIMLIVFLAVPALQRSSRNTQRKSDVGRIGAAIQEVLNNNNGDTASLTSANVQAAVGTNLAFYDESTWPTLLATPSGTVINPATISSVRFVVGAVCAAMAAGGGQGATDTGATPRSIAIVYRVEPDVTQSRTCASL